MVRIVWSAMDIVFTRITIIYSIRNTHNAATHDLPFHCNAFIIIFYEEVVQSINKYYLRRRRDESFS